MDNLEDQNYADMIHKCQANYLFEYPNEAVLALEQSDAATLQTLLATLPWDKIQNAFQKLSIDSLMSLINTIDLEKGYTLLESLPIEKANQVLLGCDSLKQKAFLELLPKQIRKEIEEIRAYPPDTAGALMDRNVIRFTPNMTVSEAIDKIKARNQLGMRYLYLIDSEGKLDSMLSMQQLVMADDTTRLVSIARSISAYVVDLDQKEEIVEKLENYRLTDIPVVDSEQHFIGVVRYYTLMELSKEELTKDILTMVGVSEDERAFSTVPFAVRKRLPWLEINLLTAFLAAAVVGLFENTIAQFTALAVLLPVVAGQSGNTGAQALAVTMRGLALKEIRTSQWLKLILKELGISIITGIVIALTTSLGVYIWSRSLGLAFIIGISMILSMVLASISGAAVPLILRRLNQDPAASSSILLTTITDVIGFFSFLGIATLLHQLI